MPQMPTPIRNRYVTAAISTPSKVMPTSRPNNQPKPIGRVKHRIGDGVGHTAERLPRHHYRWFIRPGHVLQNRFFFWSLLHR